MIRGEVGVNHGGLDIGVALTIQLSTIYQWTHQGYISHFIIGKFLRLKEKDVEKWVEKKANNGDRFPPPPTTT